jgi:uncharacterized membrane protein
MASIRNNGLWPLPTPMGVMQPSETRRCANDDLDASDMARALPALVASGDVTISRDAPKRQAPADPEVSPARHAEQEPEVPAAKPEVSPARAVEADPEPIPEAAPEPSPETSADDAALSMKGA